MTRLIPLIGLLVLVPGGTSAADLDDCTDTGSECREDCLIQYGGSVRVEMKKKYDRCIKKCSKKANLCRERVIETKNNNLEEGALDKSPGSDEVDEHGIPTRTTATRGKKDDAERETKDDLRDDLPPPAEKPEKPERTEGGKKIKPKDELREDEVPRSARTQLKVEGSKDDPSTRTKVESPKDEPVSTRTKLDKVEGQKDEPVSARTKLDKVEGSKDVKPKDAEVKGSKRDDARVTSEVKPPPKDDSRVTSEVKPPKRTDAAPEPTKDNRRPLDEDLRDDRPGAASTTKREEPPPPPPKKEEKKKDQPPPKKEEDHDDLRFY